MERGAGGLDDDERALLAAAAARAVEAHGDQTRKGYPVPYVSHLFAVSALVMEHGGTATQAAAALLHDLVEDTEVTMADVDGEFGPDVARIVDACTDTAAGDEPGHKRPWEARKTAYVARLSGVDEEAALVAGCDKLHNLTALVEEVRHQGIAAFDRFNGDASRQLWYFGALVKGLAGRVPAELAAALENRYGDLVALLPDVEPWTPPAVSGPPTGEV